jgi:hypothetical protein
VSQAPRGTRRIMKRAQRYSIAANGFREREREKERKIKLTAKENKSRETEKENLL